MKRFLAILAPLLCALAPAFAQQPAPATAPAAPAIPDAPAASGSRIIRSFDFEEKIKFGNFDHVPMFWSKVGGRGYPLYTGGQFDEKIFRSPGNSFRLDVDGGSVAYQFAPGQLPVNPNADYLVLGFIKTSPLQHAKAQINAWFADADDKIIKSTEAHSEPWASPDGKDDWHVVHLFIPGNNPAVKSLVLQVGVLQPQQLSNGGDGLGKFEIYEQDIKGSAWFDDIAVFELPRLSIRPTAIGGLFAPHKPAELQMVVSDVNHTPLKVVLTIKNAAGEVASKQDWSVQPAPDQPWNQKVTLPDLPPGFYTAAMEIGDAKGVLTRRETHFACLGDLGPPTRVSGDFGLNATRWPVDAWAELPPINSQIGTGLMKLPVWRKEMTEDSLLRKDAPFDALINALQHQEVQCTASFSEVPSVLTGKVNEKIDDVLALLDTDAAVWRPYISFILARYATRVTSWQVGRDAAYTGDPRFARLYAKAKSELGTMVSAPKMIIPWNAMYEFDPKQFPGASVELLLPAAIKPQQIPPYIQSLTQNNVDVLAEIEPLEEGKYDRVERLNDFAQRVVLARTTAARGVQIDLPMTHREDIAGAVSEPTEMLVVYRTLARELGGAAFKQELSLEPGIRALLFDRNGVGTLVLWNQNAAHAEETIRLPIGRTPQQVDLNARTSRVPLDAAGVATLKIGTSPIIIDNIDSRLVELRGGFALGQKIFPSGAGSVTTTVKLHNPYKEPLSGTLRLSLPQGWTCDPPSMTFAIAAGGEMEQAVTIRYPFSEFAGPKVIAGKLIIDGDAGRSMDVTEHVTLASDVVEMECLAHFMPTGELVLIQTITNTSAEPLNAQVYALIPGMPRQLRFILDLQPSATVVKRFVFPNADATAGKIGAAGVRLNDGTTLLTRSVPLN